MIKKIIIMTALVVNLYSEDLSSCIQGWNQTKVQNYDGAIKLFNKCIDTGNLSTASLSQTYRNMGITYFRNNQPTKAIGYFDKALTLKPKDAYNDYVNRANAWSNLKNFEKALDDYQKALLLKPNYIHAYYNRGILYSRLGLVKKADEDYKNAYKFGMKSKALIQRMKINKELESRNAASAFVATLSFYIGRTAKECKPYLSKNDDWMHSLVKVWTNKNQRFVTPAKQWLSIYFNTLSNYSADMAKVIQNKQLEAIGIFAEKMLKDTINGELEQKTAQCIKFEKDVRSNVLNITEKTEMYKEIMHLANVMKAKK